MIGQLIPSSPPHPLPPSNHVSLTHLSLPKNGTGPKSMSINVTMTSNDTFYLLCHWFKLVPVNGNTGQTGSSLTLSPPYSCSLPFSCSLSLTLSLFLSLTLALSPLLLLSLSLTLALSLSLTPALSLSLSPPYSCYLSPLLLHLNLSLSPLLLLTPSLSLSPSTQNNMIGSEFSQARR